MNAAARFLRDWHGESRYGLSRLDGVLLAAALVLFGIVGFQTWGAIGAILVPVGMVVVIGAMWFVRDYLLLKSRE